MKLRLIIIIIQFILHRYHIIYHECVTGLNEIHPIGKLPTHIQSCVGIPMVVFRDDAEDLGLAFDILAPVIFLVLSTTSEKPGGVAGAVALVFVVVDEFFQHLLRTMAFEERVIFILFLIVHALDECHSVWVRRIILRRADN